MNKKQLCIFLAWSVALVATLGSLFFSEVMRFPPCVLCWYQRIAMYPLVVIFLVGSFQSARATLAFASPLIGIGWFISLYHNLLHFGIVPESASPCLEGLSCATVYIQLLGFITIPIMSFTAFSLLICLMFILKKDLSNEK